MSQFPDKPIPASRKQDSPAAPPSKVEEETHSDLSDLPDSLPSTRGVEIEKVGVKPHLDGVGQKCIRIKADNQPCKNWAVQGSSVCAKHGGMSPTIKTAGVKRRDRSQVESMVINMRQRGLLRSHGEDKHPLVHLLDELYLSAGVVNVLGEMVGDLTDPTQYAGDDRGREAHVLYQMWAEERDRHARFAAMALRAGVAERQVKLAEQQAQLVAVAIRNILRELEMEQDPRVPQIVRKHLMALAPASGPGMDTGTAHVED